MEVRSGLHRGQLLLEGTLAIGFREDTQSSQPCLERAILCLPGQRWVLHGGGGGGGTKNAGSGGRVQNELKISQEWNIPPPLCPFCRVEKWDSEKVKGMYKDKQ